MKQYSIKSIKFFFILLLFFPNLVLSQSTSPGGYGGGYGPYEEVVCNPEPININAGDVISADVLNEILTRINNLQTGGINSEQDLIGEWSCTSTCRFGACTDDRVFNGYWKNEDGIYVVSQNLTIIKVDESKVLMTYPHNLGQSFQETGLQQCLARVKNGKIFITNNLNDDNSYGDQSCRRGLAGENYEGNCNNCYNTGTYSIEMIANQCFRMENINDSVTSCKKINIPPSSPLNLKVNLSGSSASLSWQKGDDRHTSYTLKRKQTADGAYEAIASVSTDSYADNSISFGNTYWYRVFGINEYGEGMGSNVVSITYSE